MIIEIGGGNGGFKEYLETGQKKGRDLHRDRLDQRIPLFGDLDVFEVATSAQEGAGRCYDHITLSFAENHVTDETLQAAVDEFRNHALAAWPEAERHRVAFYAEAHRPKILSYTNSFTGECVERLTHIHIGIGRRDLETGEAVELLGYLGPGSDNLKFVDAFQESFNSRHGFASPKDNPKITPENAVDILARYTGARPDALGTFNKRKAALEVLLQKEVLAKNITTWDGLGELLAAHGTVTKMNKGKFNECYRVKPHGAEKAMRLSGIFFQQQFIERSTQEKLAIISEKAKIAYLEKMQPRKESAYVAATLAEWQQTKAREHRYLHTGSSFYKNIYQPADAQTRRQLLDEIERKNHALTSPSSNHSRKVATSRNRLPGLSIRDLDGIQKRSEMLLFGDNGVYVRNEPEGQGPGSVGLRQADGIGRSGIAATSFNDLDPTTLRRDSHSQTGPGASQPIRGSGQRNASSAGELPHHQPSSVVGRVSANLRERYEQAEDKERYAEIRKNLDCAQLLASLSYSHGLNPALYQVAKAKDCTPRIQCGTRALTPSDFLTKELGLPWREAAPILRQTYEHQINSRSTKPRTGKTAPSQLWKDFKAERNISAADLAQRLKIFDGVAKAHRAALSERLKAEQRTALAGLSGPARKAAYSLEKLRMATAKAELAADLKSKRQSLRSSIQPPQEEAWCLFLQARAQLGSKEALVELRKIDNTARAEQPATPAITGTLFLDDDEEKERRRRYAESAAFILKSLDHTVERNGDVTFRQHGRAILRDEGRHLAVLDENNVDAIAAGLLIAREKFGGNLSLTGSPEFQRRAVQIAVARGIAVKFVDPQLEALRQQILAEKRQAQHAAKTPAPKVLPKQNAVFTPEALEPSNYQQAQHAAAPAAEIDSELKRHQDQEPVEQVEESQQVDVVAELPVFGHPKKPSDVVSSNQTREAGASEARSEAKAVTPTKQAKAEQGVSMKTSEPPPPAPILSSPINTFLKRHQGLNTASKSQVAVGTVVESCDRHAVLLVGRGVQVLHQFQSRAELELAMSRDKDSKGKDRG
ncbi:MAG: LPD7 domain-containing protein [Cellulomonas sp.]